MSEDTQNVENIEVSQPDPEVREDTHFNAFAQSGQSLSLSQPEPEIGTEVPADAIPVASVESEPQPSPTVAEPVNQPIAQDEEQAGAEVGGNMPASQELVSEYTYGVYHKEADSAEVFQIEFMARSSKVNDTVIMLLKENVGDPEAYTVRVKNIRLMSVYRG